MRRKRFYNNDMQERGRGRRGRNRGRSGFGRRQAANDWSMGRGWRRSHRAGYGPWQNFDNDPDGFGPPPWAPRWGGEAPAALTESADEFFGPPPWGMGRRMPQNEGAGLEDRRAWLEARKARLQAWKQHLESRLAETEAALEQMDASEDASAEQ